jgi:branched-chain amino acid transport system ATP-binding protein
MGYPVAEPILSIDKLSVGYTDEPVVVDFSIDIAAGSISTIIGPNGAGKSTLLRAIYGQNRYFSGTIHFGGRTIERLSPKERLKLGVLAGNLSGGEQQILETAMVLEAGPKLLLLDEPSLGLSPGNQDQIFEMIAQLRDGGLTVLVVEQNAHGALQISDTGIVMELGRLFMVGPAAEIASDPRIKIAYLGGQ